MNQKELTKTLMMISNKKKFVLQGLSELRRIANLIMDIHNDPLH